WRRPRRSSARPRLRPVSPPSASPRTATAPTRARSARCSAEGLPIGPAPTGTTDWSKITAASKAERDACAASRASPRQGASVEATTSSVPSSAPVPATTSPSLPAVVACFICVARQPRSPSWKPH
ncbi:MAG: Integrase, catalytic region, partial [uncultured Acetobacteraceae bacterium]